PFAPQAVIDTVQRLLRVDAQRLEALKSRAEVEARLRRLSPREREVLLLVVEGKTNKEVAAAMSISVKTVEIHRKRMMEKLEVGSIAALVAGYAPLLSADDRAPMR
ncbi:MAG: LuxR C-terminal-related transcriptional regulator, partial [Polyangiales bacterium]